MIANQKKWLQLAGVKKRETLDFWLAAGKAVSERFAK
jgi:hypothetical protein